MEIGVIGLGAMGRLCARKFAERGYNVTGCDIPERRKQAEEALAGTGVCVLNDGRKVSERSDLIFYLVDTSRVGEAVANYGPATKSGAIVSSGTSVMTPAVKAFEQYLPVGTSIVNWHWMFRPEREVAGKDTAWVKVRGSEADYVKARAVCEKLGTKFIEIPSYQEHDRITADTQVVTHLGYESMGTAWMNAGVYPWKTPSYCSGIDYVKVLMTLRLFGGTPHVYSGLAMLNPFAKEQVEQYANSESELYKLMIQERERELRERVMRAGEKVFADRASPPLIKWDKMGGFSLGDRTDTKPNSHLSLLAMVDAWSQLGVSPYKHLTCQTPLFRLRLGVCEYLFRHPELLEESIRTGLYDRSIRADDLAFHTAVTQWTAIIEHGALEGYHQLFEKTKMFFGDKIAEGTRRSEEMVASLLVA